MRLFSSHKIHRRVRQLPVELTKVWHDEIFDLAKPLRIMEPLDSGVLCSIEGRAEYTQHPSKDKLRRRVLAQTISGRAADDSVDGDDVKADVWRTVWPQAAEAKIIVDATIGQKHPVGLECSVLFKHEGFVEGRKE